MFATVCFSLGRPRPRLCSYGTPRSIASFHPYLAQIARVGKMLADEYGTATNIKSRVNKLSVLSAITSTQQRLK